MANPRLGPSAMPTVGVNTGSTCICGSGPVGSKQAHNAGSSTSRGTANGCLALDHAVMDRDESQDQRIRCCGHSVDAAVLVPVRKVAEPRQGVIFRRVRSVVGLKLLQEDAVFGGEMLCPDGDGPVEPVHRIVGDRELGRGVISSAGAFEVSHNPSDVVEGTPKILDDITSDQGKHVGHRGKSPDDAYKSSSHRPSGLVPGEGVHGRFRSAVAPSRGRLHG